MSSVLPPPEDYARLAPRPGSPVARAFDDVRILQTAAFATLLQVAYPTVGHGVHQYSGFVADPWGRLLRTLDYVHGTISGGPELAGSIGARVRGMHRTIRGTKPDGERYSAMEPEAFAWVHATLALGVLRGHEHFARAMTPEQAQAFWTQWRDVGRLIGVRYRDLPETVEGFEDYVARICATELRWTPAIPDVMKVLAAPNAPWPWMPRPLWRAVTRPLGAHGRIMTVGLMTPEVRDALRMPFSRTDERIFAAGARLSRASEPLIRGPLRNVGPLYVRARRQALERGDVASVHHPPQARTPTAA